MKHKSSIHILLRLAAGLLLVACVSRVPMPTSDSTPPSLTWTVLNQTTNVSVNVASGGSVQARGGETLLVTLKASDPEGVGYIELGGGYVKACVNSDGTGSTGQGLLATQSHALGPDANNTVATSALEILSVQADTACSGGQWDSTRVTLHGLARNFFSVQTPGNLSITFVP